MCSFRLCSTLIALLLFIVFSLHCQRIQEKHYEKDQKRFVVAENAEGTAEQIAKAARRRPLQWMVYF